MRVSILPLLYFISTFAFISALPVDYKGLISGDAFQVRDLNSELPNDFAQELADFQKRDIEALTVLFKSLNNSNTIALVRTAVQLNSIRTQVCKFAANLIEEKGLTYLLEAADESGFALDLVLMVLTHYETVDGLVDIIDEYKGSSNSSSSSSSSSLTSGILGNVLSLLGLGSSSSSSSSSSTSSTTSSTASSTDSSSSGSSSSGILGSLLSGVSSIFGLSSGSSDSGSSSSVSSASSSVADTGIAATSDAIATSDDSVTGTTIATATEALTTDATTTGTTTTSSSTSSKLTGGLSSIVSSLFGRDEITEVARKEGLEGLLKRDDVDSEQLINHLLARTIDDNLTTLEKRDALDLIYQQIVKIVGTDSNVEEILESLDKSGLGVNVVYNAFVDSGFYKLDIQLYDYLVDGEYITVSKLLSAVKDSGIVFHIAGDIIANSTYINYVIKFVLAIFTGGVNVIGLIKALF